MRGARARAIPADKGEDELPIACGAQGRMTRVLGGLLVAVAVLVACEKPVELVPDEPTTVVVEPDSVHFAALEGSVPLSATVFDQDGAEMEGVVVTWRSSDPEVARLGPVGLVTSVGDGAAAAIATSGEVEGSAKVVVAQLAASIWIRPGVDIRMDALGDTARLAAEVLDPNGRPVPDADVVWSTADGEVATVTDAGLLTGVGNGSTTVRASFGELVDFVFVSIRQVPADVRLVPAYDTIRFASFGDTADLAAEVLDPRGKLIEGAAVSWSSSDSRVASVDRDGVVDARGNGWAQISASIHALSASVWVEVDQIPTVFRAYSEVDVIAIGDSTQLRTEAFDAGGSAILDGNVAWRSSDVEVASVSAAGWVLATGEGPVEITAELKGLEASVTLSVVSSDEYALMALYDATDGRSWALNAKWKSDAPLAEWYGVDVGEDNRVVSIVLVANGLAGELPADIGRLTALESLQLAENGLEGEIVSEVGRMESLEVLDLSGNSLDGPIPPEIAQLGELRHLLLSNNDLSGEIPSELGELESLRSLDLCYNVLRGTIPAGLGDLSELETLSLCGDDQEVGSGNQLTGAIPPELGRLAQLRELDLGANRLQGPIPPELGDLSKLETLRLYSNLLTSIPAEIGRLDSLRSLFLYGNRLTGKIPPELGDLAKLDTLLLGAGWSSGSNSLSGPIPPELGELGNLQKLDLGHNELSGKIPPELGDLAKLTFLQFDHNDLTGSLPPELGDLAKLEWLVACSAGVSGSLPTELGELGELRRLYLCSNELERMVPEELGDLGSLVHLYLGGNLLSGEFPESMMAVLSLTEFFWGGNPGLCVPRTEEFEEWLESIPKSSGIYCDPAERRDDGGGGVDVPGFCSLTVAPTRSARIERALAGISSRGEAVLAATETRAVHCQTVR